MRNQSTAWDRFALSQEKLCWVDLRQTLKQMKPLLQLALAANPALRTACPNLIALITFKSTTAQKAVATRRLNKAAVASGKPASHGTVGKKRQTAAAKALLQQAEAGGAKAVAAGATPVVAPPTPGGGSPPTGTTATH